ncbi:hypothetical protein P22_0733 [Propionispora sp. 2/2-37]|uniref:methylmalonyl-CoA mutase family protein n=1 Tax=Propionispora sp. 2/2-37 TaxID=1677858 RepID=UPI0006BEE032|nr:methylmalonyl-CoA mutase family protein [Propionispora sp. 2/2-37]CUH94667.1 hypothetical protein P22_0733 [Propionispora sp. 2/2-37]
MAMESKSEQEVLPKVTFDEFSIPEYEQWKQEAVTSLKGGVFEKKLLTKTYENIMLQPIYTREHVKAVGDSPALPGTGNYLRGTRVDGYITEPWLISQECDEFLPEQFNTLLKHELEKGSTGINVVLDTATKEGRDAAPEVDGLLLTTIQDADEAFAGIDLTLYDLHMATGASSTMILAMVCAMLKANGRSFSGLSGCIGADPVGTYVQNGTLPCSLDALFDEMTQALQWAEAEMPKLRTILISGQTYHNGGASDIQEITYALATAIEYIRALQIRGIDCNRSAKRMRFSFSLGANFFMEIAKMRAARMVWAQIVESFGGDKEAQKMNVHARTSQFTKSVYDPYVNILRTTTEAFSGVVGGVDSLHVGCFDEALRMGDEFSRRIARNTQIILQNECNLRQPVDPAGGSWYIETLTQEIAEKVWNLLQETESSGGLLKALRQGLPQQAVQEVLEKRFGQLAKRADRAVGINMYANTREKLLEVTAIDTESIRGKHTRQVTEYCRDIDQVYCAEKLKIVTDSMSKEPGELLAAALEAFSGGATIGQVTEAIRQDEFPEAEIKSIGKHRFTEQFEALRQKTDDYKAKTGNNLKIFLANMGPIPQHKARADFSTGFVEVGGFEVLKNDGFPDVDSAAAAALASGAQVTVICSTDDTYPELVPPLAKKLKSEKPEMIVILAGAPAPEYEPAYREAGVDEFIHIRANCYKILSWLQTAGGIA